MKVLVPPAIDNFLRDLRQEGVFTGVKDLSEEEQALPATFAEERDYTPVETDFWEPLPVESGGEEIVFRAFLDGVQRTIMLPYRVPLPNGALVPLHIAHIAAGVLLRDSNGCLFMDPELIAARLLLLGPFHVIREKGGINIEGENVVWDTVDQTFGFPSEPNEWIVCDTTFRGTDEDRVERREGAILGDNLFNEGLIRSRAQGRVAILRQRLEFAVLAKFRKKYPNDFILVDGPLFFLDKWRRRAAKILGQDLGESREGLIEDALLKYAVGLIKTHRLRPKHPEQVIRIGPGQRSPVVRISEEVDIKGRRGELDEEGGYGGAHLTWYTRLRVPQENPGSPYGLSGLVRLDVHRSTLGIERVDILNPETFPPYKARVDEITWAVWRERWPNMQSSRESRTASQLYPIEQLENVLKAYLYPKRLLAHLLNMPKSL
ncbi:MAG: hypothetical protein H5T41_10610 [Methanomassiliicoccales archaeon]|nr:hypothetical protein [Methanomassiliicoccales archaeon]